jgi:hypothetical protein
MACAPDPVDERGPLLHEAAASGLGFGTSMQWFCRSQAKPGAQSSLLWQSDRQAPKSSKKVWQRYGPQSNGLLPSIGHFAPALGQSAAPRPWLSSVQRLGSHCVPGPAPMQVLLPVVSSTPLQVLRQFFLAPQSWRRSTPMGSRVQVPMVGATAHEWQGSVQAELQQKPSTQ